MKKIFNSTKNIIIGMVIGLTIGTTAGVFAANQFTINPNPFPINVNGEKTTDVSGLNVNGSTYLKLRDFNKLEGVGVMFDSTNKDIEIVTNGMQKFTPDDVRCDKLSDNNYYITTGELRFKAETFGYKLIKNARISPVRYQLSKDGKIVIDDMPYLLIEGNDRVTYDYYVNTLMPLFK
jgi:hypothetical protein